MTDRFAEMQVFVRVVETGRLAAAARDLGLSSAVVSRRLAALERRLGVRLLNRTTRSLALTDEGADFHAHCRRLLAELEDAEAQAARGGRTALGALHISSTAAFARRLAPLLRAFRCEHPGVSVRLHVSDAVVNLVDGGFDLAVRFGTLDDSSLIARELAPNYRVICAAPDYLDARGRPTSIADLNDHDCILMGDPPSTLWHFADGRSVHVGGAYACNDGEIAHLWAREGAGLVVKSIWDVQADIEAGRLEIVLADTPLPASPIHAVYPHRRHVAPKVRLCVAFLRERLQAAAQRLPGIGARPGDPAEG